MRYTHVPVISLFAAYLEHEPVGLDSGTAVGNRPSGDAHFTGGNQFASSHLRLPKPYDCRQSQFVHVRVLAEAVRKVQHGWKVCTPKLSESKMCL